MFLPKLSPILFLLAATATTLIINLNPTEALMPYTRNPIWDLMLPPEIDPLRILEQTPLPTPNAAAGEPLAVARCDWKETPSEHVITVDVPGMRKEDVKVEVEEETRVVRISGEREVEKEKEGDKWHRAERVSARFVRQFRLPADADLDGVKVRLENGVLRVVVPKLPEEKRKKGAKVVAVEEAAGGGEGDVKAATTGKGEL